MLNMIRKITLKQANKLMIVTRSASKAAGTAPPPVHGVKKHLDPNVKPEHDKPPQNQNKQKSPTSADTKPKVLLRPKLPASQIVRKRLIDKSIKLLNKPKPQWKLPNRSPAIPNQLPQNLPPPVQRDADNRQEVVPLPVPDNRPLNVRPPPIRHFNPNPSMEVPQEDHSPQEISQKPTSTMDNSAVVQDPFDTQMEVPFSEDIVEPVFKRPDMADFEIPPVLEEMIPDGALIHKNLPKQVDMDRILAQINRKYLRRMHLPCSLRDMQAAYMQSPHFCDIYNVLLFNRYPKSRKAMENLGKLCSVNK